MALRQCHVQCDVHRRLDRQELVARKLATDREVVGRQVGNLRISHDERSPAELVGDIAMLQLEIRQQQRLVDRLREDNVHNMNALSVRLAELQAASTRIDALGERLAQMGQLSLDEFDFSQPAPLGGAGDLDTLGPSSEIDLRAAIVALSDKLRRQSSQLDALQSLMVNRQLEADLTPAGWPVSTTDSSAPSLPRM